MSGVIHGLFVLGLLPQALKRDWIAVACLVYLLGKLAYEMVTGAPLSDAKAIGGHVVTEAHLYGSIVAFIYGLILGTFIGLEVPSPTSDSSTATTCTMSADRKSDLSGKRVSVRVDLGGRL